jgi:hypothetical protein
MWHRLKNLFSILKSYPDLRPDLRVRQQVKRTLRHRPVLEQDEWFEAFYKARGIAYPIAIFAYTHLEKYSGLKLGSVWPTDRLEEELRWTEVCWFDWEQALCKDFYRCFNVEIDDCLDPSKLQTIEDLLLFLNRYGYSARGSR